MEIKEIQKNSKSTPPEIELRNSTNHERKEKKIILGLK